MLRRAERDDFVAHGKYGNRAIPFFVFLSFFGSERESPSGFSVIAERRRKKAKEGMAGKWGAEK